MTLLMASAAISRDGGARGKRDTAMNDSRFSGARGVLLVLTAAALFQAAPSLAQESGQAGLPTVVAERATLVRERGTYDDLLRGERTRDGYSTNYTFVLKARVISTGCR